MASRERGGLDYWTTHPDSAAQESDWIGSAASALRQVLAGQLADLVAETTRFLAALASHETVAFHAIYTRALSAVRVEEVTASNSILSADALNFLAVARALALCGTARQILDEVSDDSSPIGT